MTQLVICKKSKEKNRLGQGKIGTENFTKKKWKRLGGEVEKHNWKWLSKLTLDLKKKGKQK